MSDTSDQIRAMVTTQEMMNPRTRFTLRLPILWEISVGISNIDKISSSNQLGPGVRGSGNMMYNPPTASKATAAAQRGSASGSCLADGVRVANVM